MRINLKPNLEIKGLDDNYPTLVPTLTQPNVHLVKKTTPLNVCVKMSI
jgi:hypothetical protein